MNHHLILLNALFFLSFTCAFSNVTISCDDANITYTSSTGGVEGWSSIAMPDGYLYSGTYMLSSDPNAKAAFTFWGVALYYTTPLWYPSADAFESLQLDDYPPFNFSMVSDDTRASATFLIAQDMPDTEHVVVIKKDPISPFVSVGQFVVTVPNLGDMIFPDPRIIPPSQSPVNDGHRSKVLKIVIPLTVIIGGMVLVLLSIFWIWKFPQYCCFPFVRRLPDDNSGRSKIMARNSIAKDDFELQSVDIYEVTH